MPLNKEMGKFKVELSQQYQTVLGQMVTQELAWKLLFATFSAIFRFLKNHTSLRLPAGFGSFEIRVYRPISKPIPKYGQVDIPMRKKVLFRSGSRIKKIFSENVSENDVK